MTGAIVLALVIPLTLLEVLPVFGFVIRVLAHVVPEYVSLLCGLPIIVAW